MADELDDLPGPEAETKPNPTAKQTKPKTPAPREEIEEDDDPPPPKKHRHTPGMVQLARHFGYSQDDLDETSPADLRSELSLLQTEVGRATPKPTAEPAKKPTPEAVDEEEAYLAKLEANPEMDQEHVKFLRKLKAKAEAADKKAAKVEEFDERDKKRETAKHVEMLDNAFAALPKKYHKLFGTDGMADITNPGVRGWRMEGVKEAKIEGGESQRSMNKKIAEAAAKIAAGEVEEDEPEPNPNDPYELSKPKKKVQAKDPETGRFTEEDFARAKIAKPSVKKIAAGELTAVEATRNYLRQNGDPRGFRTPVEMDDDELPG
jgi:hypothetical protein